VEAIDDGDFRKMIEAQIRKRAYFLPILTPTSLERCRQSNDLLRKEFETAVEGDRRIVPLVTPDFERKEITDFLPEPLASRYLALNTITVVHEYFEASMEKLRKRFLKPVEVPMSRMDPVLARDAERLTEVAAAQPPVGPTGLNVQKHLERAFAATHTELTVTEFERGSDLLPTIPKLNALMMKDFDLAYLELQARLQHNQAAFVRISEIMKAAHDTAKIAIAKIR
jgi:hypothetical protein